MGMLGVIGCPCGVTCLGTVLQCFARRTAALKRTAKTLARRRKKRDSISATHTASMRPNPKSCENRLPAPLMFQRDARSPAGLRDARIMNMSRGVGGDQGGRPLPRRPHNDVLDVPPRQIRIGLHRQGHHARREGRARAAPGVELGAAVVDVGGHDSAVGVVSGAAEKGQFSQGQGQRGFNPR